MKKNIFKKVVASLATVAMAAGLFTAMPAEEAKAEDPVTKTIYLVTTEGDENSYAASAWSGAVVEGVQIKDKPFDTWGDGAPYAAVKVQDGLYKIQFKFWPNLSENTGFQIAKYTPGANNNSGLYKAENDKAQWGTIVNSLKDADTTEVWIKLSDSWAVEPTTPVTIEKTDAEFAAEAEAVIDEALAVEPTKENKDKYETAMAAFNALSEAQQDLVDDAKVLALADGVATIVAILEAEQAAKDAAEAGKLTVYVKNADWTNMSVYGWGGADFGEWSGTPLTALTKNEGWFSITTDITKAVNLIFNNGTDQTVNWENISAGTYWLVLSDRVEEDGKLKYTVDNVSTTAPEGWQDEAAEEIGNDANVPGDGDGDGAGDGDVDTDTTPKGVTVEVTLGADVKWEKVYLHAWGEGFGTEWPGVEMTKKDGKWYATIDTNLTKLSFVVSNGNGDQTVDIENVEGTEVKITLNAKNADGKYEVTANGVATGIVDSGDSAAIYVLLAVAVVAAGMVVASKKKVICE